ncbi:hypothetical protein Tco_1352301 [Tanacetum coccineum]
MNEGLQAFMDQVKFESSHINGVPPVLRTLFMHGYRLPELAKKLNDKIPKSKIFKIVTAFIRGEASARSAERLRKDSGKKQSEGVPKEYGNMCFLFKEARIDKGNYLPGNTLEQLDRAPIILEGEIEGYHVRRIYVDGGSSSEIMYEHCFKSFELDIKSKLK